MLQENSIHRYLHSALDALPTPFAQLVFLTSLRDPYTGHYLHEGWTTVTSPAEVNAILRETHKSVFDSVIDQSLVALSRELRKHFQALGEAELRSANLWLAIEPYYHMIPEGCSLLSRRFFISQVRLALEVLVQAPGWPQLAEQTSSPLPPPAPLPRPQWLN
jgi:hypothetical protein